MVEIKTTSKDLHRLSLAYDELLHDYHTLRSAAMRVVFADREQFEDPTADEEIEEAMDALAAACGVKPVEE